MLRSLLVLSALAATFVASAQPVDPSLFGGLHWRLVGPFRGGRALAVAGVPGSPEKFYQGTVGGGVWVTENAGRTWTPIFDKQPTASIGAIAVAPSDPNVIYVGSGEADMRSDIQQGNGMYKSTDAGKTWSRIGLEDSRQIGKILVDPKDPNIVYVAALGHQYGPNEQRGVFKSTDGGATWTKSLTKDSNTGAIDMAMDPTDSSVIFASMWQTRRPPWSIYPPSNGPGSGLYKSTDAGGTWTQIQGHGFPAKVGRIGISISPANHERVYACVDSADPKLGGVYRSDDSGENWTQVGKDPRVWGRGWYFMGITADPKNPDRVYVMNTSAYRSTDGGKTFIAFKGAPGGDDYHTCWIAPDDPNRMILGSDQGTIVSVDGGKSWSSWYNQPTGQFYHVITDNRFPYWIYGAQQDSGAMAVPSRTIHTGISPVYQRPIDAGGESGTIAPDPLHPGLLFSSTGSKEDIETGWEQFIEPTVLHPETTWRSEWTQPIAVSPVNKHVFYTSRQNIFRTDNGGSSWKIISPDLTRKRSDGPLPNLDAPTAADNDGTTRRGVVYWLAPSPLKAKQLWAGTDDGLIWLTRDDGANWKDVTPKALTPWSKVGVIDASHFSSETAYAAIDRHRIDDNHPYIYSTHNGGKSWELITRGIPKDQFVNVVREDPKQAGLLYAGTDWGVFVSFNDGTYWQPLQLNLPAASVRDIVFGGNDVVVGTHGRAIWILDDVSRLRQLASAFQAFIGGSILRPTPAIDWETANGHAGCALFKPAPAILFQRAGTFGFGRFDEGTPLPPEEPVGENAPWGAVIDYSVDHQQRYLTLTIKDSDGHVLRRITNTDAQPKVDWSRLDIPAYWEQPSMMLSGAPGGHRYIWDLRSGSSIGRPLLPPGLYTVELTGDGKRKFHYFYAVRQLVVTRDPRLHVTDADLRAQYRFALEIDKEYNRVKAAREKALKMLKGKLSHEAQDKLRALTGAGPMRRRRRDSAPTQDTSSLTYIGSALEGLVGAVESAPSAPTEDYRKALRMLKEKADKGVQAVRALTRGN